MDADESGTIDRLEWMAYLCSTTTDLSGKGGKDYYDFELREQFEKCDVDKDGTIDTRELITFIKKQCSDELNQVSENEKWKLDGEFRASSIEMFETLTGRKPVGKTDGLTWVEMKHFKSKCELQLYKIK